MAFDFTNPWDKRDKIIQPDWSISTFGSVLDPPQQQSIAEKVYLTPNSPVGSGYGNTYEEGTNKLLKLGFMQADITVKNVKAKDLRAVQVVYLIPGPSSFAFGKDITIGGKTYKGFVDGGRNSPDVANGGQVGDPNKPYLFGTEMRNDRSRAGLHSWNGTSGRTVISDEPFAAFDHKELYFETYLVASEYDGTRYDKVLAKWSWGFTNFGINPIHSSNLSLTLTNSLSGTAKKIISNDGYSYVTTS